MYEHFFNLTAEPFRLSPDHRFCYNHAQYAKAKAYMAYAFMRAEGFVMVTGQPGTGKTTLIGDLVESLADENVAVANLVSTQLAADDLLRMVAFAFGLAVEAVEKSSVLHQLNARFLALHREGGRALLIVDEAQDLTPKAMEELRLLTNLQLDGKPLLQIFLLGQPELRDLIHGQGLEQVHQRIIATSNLRALKEDETRAYVEHRLRVVGWRNDPAISSAVFPIISQFSEGVPRRINLICSRLFLHTFVEQRHQIGVEDARTVVQELQEEQLSTRNLLNSDLFYAEDVFEYPLEDVYEHPLQGGESTMSANRRAPAGVMSASAGVGVGHNESPPPPASAVQNLPGEYDDVHQSDQKRVVLDEPRKLRPVDASSEPRVPSRQQSERGKSHVPMAGDRAYAPSRTSQVNSLRAEKRPIGLELWVTLFFAVVAGVLVALFVGIDRIL